MVLWVISLIFYFYVRIAKTMDLGDYLAYGIFVLVVEVNALQLMMYVVVAIASVTSCLLETVYLYQKLCTLSR